MKGEILSNDESIVANNDESGQKDLDWAIGLNRLSLRLMGIWPDDKYLKTSILKYLSVVLRIPTMVFWLVFCMVLPQMYALTLVNKDLSLFLDNLMTCCPAITGSIKLFFLWRNSESLRPVVNTVTEDWLRPKLSWEYQTMRKEASVAKLFTVCGCVFVGVTYVGYICAPFFGTSIRIITNITDYGDRHLLMQTYYPYDYSKSPNFELTQISQVIGSGFICMGMAIPDNFFGVLVFHLSAQFKILGISIELFTRENCKSLVHGRSKIFNRRFGMFINRHVHLIRMVSVLEETFNLLTFVQLFCMSVIVCCSAIRIIYAIQATDEEVLNIQLLTLIGALVSLMLFTFIDCLATEVLATHSSELFYHVYNCDWYRIPAQNARDFILIMLMSKNPQILTAGKIIPLSLESYCTLLKTIGGYISVLVALSS